MNDIFNEFDEYEAARTLFKKKLKNDILRSLSLENLWERYNNNPNIPNKLPLSEFADIYDISMKDIFSDDSNDEHQPARKLFKKKLINDLNKSVSPKTSKITEISNIVKSDDQNNENNENNNNNEITNNFEASYANKPDEKPEDPDKTDDEKIPYGETEEYKHRHHGMTFNQSSILSYYSKDKIQKLKEYLESDRKDWYIDFKQYNSTALHEIQPYLIRWFEEKIGKLTGKYLFSFLVDDEWKSLPMNSSTYKKLNDSLNNGSLVFDVELDEDYKYDADKNYQIPRWSLFSALKIFPIKKVKARRDNGG